MPSPLPTRELRTPVRDLELFEATESHASTGTGPRREGEASEKLVLRFWDGLTTLLRRREAKRAVIQAGRNRCRSRLTSLDRVLYRPTSAGSSGAMPTTPCTIAQRDII